MKYLIFFAALVFGSLIAEAQKELPANQIQKKDKLLIQKKIHRANMYIPLKVDTSVTLSLSRQKLNYFKQNKIDLAEKGSELIENYNAPVLLNISPKPSSDFSPFSPDNGQQEIISQRINENEGFEIKYADGSIKILEYDGTTFISPDGQISRTSYMQVSPVIPPSLPDDEDQVNFLQKVSDELLGILSEALNNDSASIANFNIGDGPNIYENINRRIRFLNYINQQK